METQKTDTDFTFGNFKVDVKLDEAVVTTLANSPELVGYVLDGITQKLQRKPASAVEKALAGYDKRPPGFDRKSIPFSEAAATKILVAFGEAVADVAEVAVVEHVPDVAEAKMVEERKIHAAKKAAGALPALAEKVGYAGDATDEEAFVRAIRAWSVKQKKEIEAELMR